MAYNLLQMFQSFTALLLGTCKAWTTYSQDSPKVLFIILLKHLR